MSKSYTGARYVEAITTSPADRSARAAFRDLVLKIARPGATLFDFGAGPGLDARFYAEHGFTVGAYDVDPEMREYFYVHCRELIQDGLITLDGRTFEDFLVPETGAGGHRVELVTSNFAPLNLIENLQPLFAKFHAFTTRDGRVLASVLSPYFIGDMKYGWWWRNAVRLWRTGSFCLAGASGPIIRRRLVDFAAQSLPYFTLEHVFPGLPSSSAPDAGGVDIGRGPRHAWLRVTTCQYMFLLFRKHGQTD
jgi:hypothetical protein